YGRSYARLRLQERGQGTQHPQVVRRSGPDRRRDPAARKPLLQHHGGGRHRGAQQAQERRAQGPDRAPQRQPPLQDGPAQELPARGRHPAARCDVPQGRAGRGGTGGHHDRAGAGGGLQPESEPVGGAERRRGNRLDSESATRTRTAQRTGCQPHIRAAATAAPFGENGGRMTIESWATELLADCLVPVSVTGKAKIQSRDYKRSGRFPVIDQGQEPIAGWTDDESAGIDTPLPLIVFGDHTRVFKFLDAPFARGADGTQLLCPKPGIDPLFFFYACRAIDLPARGYNRHFTVLKEKELSYPSSDGEQKAIAAVLRQTESALVQQSSLLDTLQELKRATMRELFTRGLRGEPQKDTEIGPVPESWETRTILDLCEIWSGGTPR